MTKNLQLQIIGPGSVLGFPAAKPTAGVPEESLTLQRYLQGGKVGISLPRCLSAYGENLLIGPTPNYPNEEKEIVKT